jgi:pyridoxine 4-dehydrogenase
MPQLAQPLTDQSAGTFSLGGELTVRRLGFGTMRLTGEGIWGPPDDRDEAIRVLRRAIELGVNLIDTADSYGPEVAEALIAEALHPYPDDLVIATKGGLTRPGPSKWERDARPEHLRAACEGSLRRLRVDRIDLYQLHAPDPDVPFERSVQAIAELREEGKVRLVGLSNVSVDQLERALEIVPIASVQNRYNLDDRDADDVVDACAREGIAFFPWAPVGGGSVSRGAALARIARDRGATPTQISLAWLLRRAPVMVPIPGTSSIAHLEENAAAAGMQLSEAEFAALGGAAQPENTST